MRITVDIYNNSDILISVELTQRCQLNGKTYTMNLNCTMAQLNAGAGAYQKGALLQNAFPFLNAGEREFLKTGTPPHVWDAMFAEPDGTEREDYDADERAASVANNRYYGAGD